ncbi:MAG: N-6 DNA methylase [Candidatus Gracilibacteria bacterium]
MTKQEAKQQIANLVEKYQRIAEAGKIKTYNEAQTRNEFIEPLFEFLGWDMRNLTTDNEVTTEENVSGDRVDLAFRFNNIPVMFLEAKAMKVDLDEWKWAEQAINYSWNKSVTWAILTDFESVKIFNAEMPPKSISQNLFIEIKCQDYVDRFDQLWLLSKESFEQKLLDKEAQKWGKLTQRKQVGEKLFEDLMSWRVLLTKDFKNQNNLTDEELDEGVQRILDRLIFIRTAEDRKIEQNILLSVLREWETKGKKHNIYKRLTDGFRWFDENYNSKLFAPHYCEEWKASDKAISEVIKGLYETRDNYRYDFSAISADVLGGMYEQYLGYVQGRKSEEKQKSTRKSQGIYYTPKYIVEFIVKETLGEVLKKTKPKDLAKIKVLDPACGSGSFLTAAYDKVLETLTKQDPQTSLFAKFDILKENIFGVDLDAQAIEIAQLNLLLKVLSRKTKLPTLQHNISSGNSLVSGNAEKLEKYFGSDFREQKAFNFEDEFKDVFDQGGFDVIIGNPPYVAITGIDFDLRRIYEKMYQTAVGRFDLFMLFIEKSINLLKEGGFLGFIIPNKFLTNNQSQKLREYILEKGQIKAILFTQEKVFAAASVNSVVLIFEKTKKTKKCNLHEYKDGKVLKVGEIDNSDFRKDTEKRFIISQGDNSSDLLAKINVNSVKLDEIAEVRDGIVAGRIKDLLFHKEKINSSCKPLLFGNDINRYQKTFSNNYVDYREEYMKEQEGIRVGDKGLGLRLRYKELYERPKILTRKTADKIIATYDDENYYYEQTLHSTHITNKKYLSLYVLALLNSTLFKYFYQSIVKQSGTIFPQVRISMLKSLPIKQCSIADQEKIAKKAQTMLDLNKELQATSANTDKHNSLQREIEKLDREIDEAIYKLYGLTNEEIKTIEQ